MACNSFVNSYNKKLQAILRPVGEGRFEPTQATPHRSLDAQRPEPTNSQNMNHLKYLMVNDLLTYLYLESTPESSHRSGWLPIRDRIKRIDG